MTNITNANIDWEIVKDVRSALEDARLNGEPVFNTVDISMSSEKARENNFSGDTPIAIIVWDTTEEENTVESVKHNRVALSLVVADDITADTDGDRLQAAQSLCNSVRNIIEANPPSDASAWGKDSYYQEKIVWGAPDIQRPTSEEGPPWVIIVIPVVISYVSESGTTH